MVRQLMLIAWSTSGPIVSRARANIMAAVDRLAGLRRIEIKEISCKKNHKYVTVVICRDTARLVWAAPRNDEPTLGLLRVWLTSDV
jgi:transposase